MYIWLFQTRSITSYPMIHFDKLHHIPHQPWVYIFKSQSSQILYIWKAKNLHHRVSQYFNPNSVWKQDMMSKAEEVEFMVCQTESEALYLEDNLIKKHIPPYNRLLKGDNSYVYIKITHEDRPQVIVTRYRNDDGATYIGPKHMRGDLKQLLQLLRQILKYRWCKTTQFRKGLLCSDYLFGICAGRCVYDKLNSTKSAYYLELARKQWFEIADTMSWPEVREIQASDYRRIMNLIVAFFEGKTEGILSEIKGHIDQAIQLTHFEWAAKLRDIYVSIGKMVEKQTVVIDISVSGMFFKIKEIWQYRVYAIVTFQAGKMVDVLRFKEKISDIDIDDLIRQIEMEYGAVHYTQQ